MYAMAKMANIWGEWRIWRKWQINRQNRQIAFSYKYEELQTLTCARSTFFPGFSPIPLSRSIGNEVPVTLRGSKIASSPGGGGGTAIYGLHRYVPL